MLYIELFRVARKAGEQDILNQDEENNKREKEDEYEDNRGYPKPVPCGYLIVMLFHVCHVELLDFE
jgi:hypothetical protein